ncbi:MAG: RNase adapter RapZ [Deltaproteobacteria bacterium]|nr:RNase adapter RapZ [Deltaproteobacteria bacterium]
MKRQLVIITGLSGSGKSTGARALEDAGYFVIDNLPLVMLPDFLSLTDHGYEKVAAVVDARSSDFLGDCHDVLRRIKAEGHDVEVLFFDASDHDLVKRFSETRRRHPLVQKEGILAAISREREIMSGLRSEATVILDSSGLTVHQLRQRVLATVLGSDDHEGQLQVQVQSFGFRNGLPLNADLVFDVRFLDNPHFVEELRPKTGLTPEVSSFVLSQPDYQMFLDKLKDLLFFLLPRYRQEGKTSLTISIGCTGGQHRSVAIAEDLGPYLLGIGCMVQVNHRDIAL